MAHTSPQSMSKAELRFTCRHTENLKSRVPDVTSSALLRTHSHHTRKCTLFLLVIPITACASHPAKHKTLMLSKCDNNSPAAASHLSWLLHERLMHMPSRGT